MINKDKYNAEIANAMVDAISRTDLMGKIDNIIREDYKTNLNNTRVVNDILSSTLDKIALMLGIKESSYFFMRDPLDLQKECDKFINKIESKISKGVEVKQRILTFAVNDCYGHCQTERVTKKSIDYVNTALSCHCYEGSDDVLLENIFDKEPLGKLANSILVNSGYVGDHNNYDSINKWINNTLYSSKYDLKREIKKVFTEAIKNDDVTVSEFSEMLTEIIATRRGDGSLKWTT